VETTASPADKDTLVKPRLPLAVVILAAALAGGGCEPHRHTPTAGACAPDPAPIAGQQVRGCLSAADQAGDGTSVTVTDVDIHNGPGWIVLHTDDGGEPGPRISVVPIRQGRSTQVSIPVTSRMTTGNYWPMLHVDAGIPGTYEFPAGPDVPVVDSQGMVMKLIHVTVR
jgi:hypothetical protein